MWRPETCCGFRPNSASLLLRSTSHAIREKRKEHRRPDTTPSRRFERKVASIAGLFQWSVYCRFDHSIDHVIDLFPWQAEVVGQNRESDLLSFCSYGVSGKRLDSTQRTGFRIDVRRRIEVLAAVGERTVYARGGKRIAELLAPGLCGGVTQQFDNRVWGDEIFSRQAGTIVKGVIIAGNASIVEKTA